MDLCIFHSLMTSMTKQPSRKKNSDISRHYVGCDSVTKQSTTSYP